MSADPRKARLDAAVAELAVVEADIWKLAAAARIILGASGDPQAQQVAGEIEKLEDRRVCARVDVRELAREIGVEGTP